MTEASVYTCKKCGSIMHVTYSMWTGARGICQCCRRLLGFKSRLSHQTTCSAYTHKCKACQTVFTSLHRNQRVCDPCARVKHLQKLRDAARRRRLRDPEGENKKEREWKRNRMADPAYRDHINQLHREWIHRIQINDPERYRRYLLRAREANHRYYDRHASK
jgi:hypothetical protein